MTMIALQSLIEGQVIKNAIGYFDEERERDLFLQTKDRFLQWKNSFFKFNDYLGVCWLDQQSTLTMMMIPMQST